MSIHSCKRRQSMVMPLLALIIIIIIIISSASFTRPVQARVLEMTSSSFSHHQPQKQQGSYSRSKLLDELGMVCKCCDDNGDNCKTSWDGSCPSKLQCLPWKFS
ncbi:hypothetical protein SAY87_022556 [Trapa incisa]|uniref:Uncharacterized protein n=1 Tax=Trapa incisa TaxID=236973 RepID=A0AAN7Q9D6_9MYRT|nr:hypothetical protein SAY87_022556 [Trapa incisa]